MKYYNIIIQNKIITISNSNHTKVFNLKDISFLFNCIKLLNSWMQILCLIQKLINTKYGPDWQKVVLNLGRDKLISLTNRVLYLWVGVLIVLVNLKTTAKTCIIWRDFIFKILHSLYNKVVGKSLGLLKIYFTRQFNVVFNFLMSLLIMSLYYSILLCCTDFNHIECISQ